MDGEGEKPSKYFLNLEKRNLVSKSINFIVNNDNSRLTQTEDILSETRDYYKALYSYRKVDRVNLQPLFERASTPTLSDTMRDQMEGPLTHEELLRALRGVKMKSLRVRTVLVSNFTSFLLMICLGFSSVL